MVQKMKTLPATGSDTKGLEDKFSSLLEIAPDAIVIVDKGGRIVLANSQIENLFGYKRQEIINEMVDRLVPERFRSRHAAQRNGFFAEPHMRPIGTGLELFGMRKDGVEFPIEISLNPLEIEDEILITAAIRDITERKRFEHALHEKNLELEQANLAKDRFLADISHELRTPLNAILGFAGTLLMKLPGPLTHDQEKQLRMIQTSARHLLSLINDLPDLTRTEAGKVELNLESVRCQSVLEEVATALRPQAESKGLHLQVITPPSDVFIQTDHRLLSQILLNLANNAIKFTDYGEVRIELCTPHLSKAGRMVVEISVEDTGIGMRHEEQARLFQAFEELDNSNAHKHEGTGLGLYLSQKLATLLGGNIAVESVHGLGSAFRLMIAEQ